MSEPRIHTPGRRAMAEGVATFFFVLLGTGAIMIDARTGGEVGIVGIALAFAFALIVLVYAIGHLSGGHINPAVTIALWAVRRFPAKDALLYIVAQCVGATAASLVLWGMLGEIGGVGATVPTIAASEAFAVEWMLTFVLMFVIAAVASDERVAYGFAGVAIGLTVGADVIFGYTLTGASMNPARSLGPAVAAGIWDAHWIYWLAPILGAVAGAWTYETLRSARSPDLSFKRDRLFGVGGPIAEAVPPAPTIPAPPRRRSGVDRRKKDVGPPPGVRDRREGADRRDV